MNLNIDDMLYKDMLWLSERADLTVGQFVILAKRLDLRESDWAMFWKIIRKYREEK